ncbi:MAG: protein-glutamate O-methyltransferase [Bacteroidales bacterium]|nr:protein-glutamate O-methyltransferase [Bacteroidales bacterium]HPD95790.1 protein-glutamate O-methyltransferase [Tenuifilaceae bacterium]
MAELNLNDIYRQQLSDAEFKKLSSFIYNECGIKLPPIKRVMLQCRLQKRLRHLQLGTFKDYIDYLFNSNGGNTEIIHMLDVVSTNKTDFFRESSHFDYMQETVLPEFAKKNQMGTLKVWSAGCSSGEEPYTLVMVLYEFAEKNSGFNFSIWATDISTRILETAMNGVYKEEKVAVVPLSLKKKYMLKSKDRINPTVKMAPHVRSKVNFARLNLMDEKYSVPETFDVIFCRNVLIYFDRDTQESVINKLCNKLKPGGYLFLGHSESILNMNVPLKQVNPTIYIRL